MSESGPVEIWTAELGHRITHPPLVVGQTLIVASQPQGRFVQHGRLQGIELETGHVSWQHNYEFALVTGMQAYHLILEDIDVAVVTASSSDFLQGSGSVLAFNEAGEIIWRWQPGEESFSAPLVQNRRVYLIAGSKTLTVVSPEEEGTDEHRIPLTASASYSAPIMQDGIAYIPCRGPELLAVEVDGGVRWHFQFQNTNQEWLDQTPVLAEDLLFAASSLGTLLAIDKKNGNQVWSLALGDGRPLSRPALFQEHLYIGSRYGLTALEMQNGRIAWQFETPRPAAAQPLIFHDTVYFTSEDHHLYAVALEDGAERWRYELPHRIEMPPVLTPTSMVVADRGGRVVALERPFLPEPSAESEEPLDTIQQKAAKQTIALAYEEAGIPHHAAPIWFELGDLEQAAKDYEKAQKWPEAAQLWQQLDRYGMRAQALEKHAYAQSQKVLDNEEKAAAWQQAALAYVETGDKEARQRCEQEVARYRREPVLGLEIHSEPMVLNTWTRLGFTVTNTGFGVARYVKIKLKDDRFEGQVARTQTMITLAPGRDYSHWLDVCPRAQGNSVPMQLIIEYMDKLERLHKLERTFYLDVSGAAIMPTILSPHTPEQSATPDSRQILAELSAADGRDLPGLRAELVRYFSLEELIDMLFELSLNADEFNQERASRLAREMIVYLVRNGRLAELITLCQRRRPHIAW